MHIFANHILHSPLKFTVLICSKNVPVTALQPEGSGDYTVNIEAFKANRTLICHCLM